MPREQNCTTSLERRLPARCVDGFAISEQSLACGLAVAKRQSIIAPDGSDEPRWKLWSWLAEEFRYHACWSSRRGILGQGPRLLRDVLSGAARRDAARPRPHRRTGALAATVISRHQTVHVTRKLRRRLMEELRRRLMEGQSGHTADIAEGPSLTHSGEWLSPTMFWKPPAPLLACY